MKKTIFVTAISMALLLAACGADNSDKKNENKEKTAVEKTKDTDQENTVEEKVTKDTEETEEVTETNKAEEVTKTNKVKVTETDKVKETSSTNSKAEKSIEEFQKERLDIANKLIKQYFDGLKKRNVSLMNKVSPNTTEDNENTVMYFKDSDLVIDIKEISKAEEVGEYGYYNAKVKFTTATEDINFDENVSEYQFTIDFEKQIILQKAIINVEYLNLK